jgi:hypothetical protein
VLVPANATIRSGSAQIAFGALKVGLLVEIHGSMQGTVVNAQDVNVEDALDAVETEFSGTLASIGGTCPALTLSVDGKAVVTAASTEFAKAACGDLKAGMLVEVKGTTQSDGSIAASRVQVDDNGGK